MTDVTHAKCPRCNTFEPVIWHQIKIMEIHVDGQIGEFVGMECECRSCQFKIATLGTVSRRRAAA